MTGAQLWHLAHEGQIFTARAGFHRFGFMAGDDHGASRLQRHTGIQNMLQ